MIHIEPISAFSDNYIWCLYRDDGDAYVVDPGDAAPVEAFLQARNLTLRGVLITHHHFDHVGGLPELSAARSIDVIGPQTSAPEINKPVVAGETPTVLGVTFEVIAVPGHTLDHIAFYAADHEPPLLFCGDTLFAGGCGRLFEGSPAQMHASLERLKALPAETAVYCAHEYTLANLTFARAVEPDNSALHRRFEEAAALRDKGKATVPSSIELERATNPFLRWDSDSVRDSAGEYASISLREDRDVFAAVRRWKDNF